MTGETHISLRSVSKQFGLGSRVLQDVSLEVSRGEFVSFIGPSGCGKSTLLRLVSGLETASAGTVTVDGRSPVELPEGQLAFVFQDATLLPWLSVRRNVAVPLRLRTTPASERDERVKEALAQVRLSEKALAFPRQLSGGQKMRVSIARALVLNPKVLLLDEPFGALDEMTRDHLNEELLNLREKARWTALFVTHSVAEAVFLSHRVVVLAANPGRVHEIIRVPLDFPRTVETRQTDRFHEMVDHVSRTLRSIERVSSGRS